MTWRDDDVLNIQDKEGYWQFVADVPCGCMYLSLTGSQIPSDEYTQKQAWSMFHSVLSAANIGYLKGEDAGRRGIQHDLRTLLDLNHGDQS